MRRLKRLLHDLVAITGAFDLDAPPAFVPVRVSTRERQFETLFRRP